MYTKSPKLNIKKQLLEQPKKTSLANDYEDNEKKNARIN